jgi:RNA polymerase sigma-70 factor (ECF subfamily)
MSGPMRVSNDEFRVMVEEHQRMVFGIAVRLLNDRGAAEEVAQDVFLELYDSLAKLEGRDHVKFWLRRVAVHRATDALRRRGRRPELVAEEWDERQHDLPQPVDERTVTDRLEAMLRGLPEPYRTTVVLRYADEATPDEIALIVGRPVATVKSHLQRGLGMLRPKADVMLKEWTR